MKWTETQWHQVGRDLQIAENGASAEARFRADHRVKEEVLETILALNLERLCGLPLYYAGRGHTAWESEDLVAWDDLGRVHIFELKKKSIGQGVTDQLSQYAFAYLFQSAEDFIESRWRVRNQTLEPGVLESYIAGAWTNERIYKLGLSYVISNLPARYHDETSYEREWPPSGNWWRERAGDPEKRDLILQSLIAKAEKHLGEDGEKELQELADMWRTRLPSLTRPPRPTMRADRPMVLWLVAPNVTDDAAEEIRQWRAKGLDARALRVDVRQSNESLDWDVGVTREDFPARTKLECELIERARGRDKSIDRRPHLRTSFYTMTSASSGIADGDGAPLDEPYAEVERVPEPEWVRFHP